MHGAILPANAPFAAHVTLVLELAMGVALVFGAWLARRGHYRLHALCQSSVVLLNLVVIAMSMAPSLYKRVLPKIPARLGRSFYAVALAHGVIGIVAEVAAIFVLVAAGLMWLPIGGCVRVLRKARRTVLFFWGLALLRGVTTSLRWYAQR